MEISERRQFDESAKIMWNESYRLSKAKNLWGAAAVPYVDHAIDVFKSESCISVIDIPCGDGRNMVELLSGVPFVVGMDSSNNALSIADAALREKKLKNYVLLQGDLFDTKFQTWQFDGVFCWDVLGHLRAPHLALSELHRICRDDGVVIASFFAHGDSTKGVGMVALGENKYIFAESYYFRYYGADDVRKLVEACGFAVVRMDLVRWVEPPHEGYREYEHEHESWAVVLKKVKQGE